MFHCRRIVWKLAELRRIGLLTLVVIAGVIGFFGWWNNGRIIRGISVAGIELGGLRQEAALQVLDGRRFTPLPHMTFYYQQHRFEFNPHELGIQVNRAATVRQALLYGHQGSFWSQIVTRWRIRRQGYAIKPVFHYNLKKMTALLRRLDREIAVEVRSADVSVDRQGQIAVTPDRQGISIDHALCIERIFQAVMIKNVSVIAVPVRIKTPALTKIQITRWDLDEILGSFTTRFDPDQADRVQNMALASKAIHNVLILPGHDFSFNQRVGPRVPITGYREAPVIFQNKIISGIGGGVCQVSSTLYNAALLANLEVLQRSNHSMPISYLPLARDATVVYGGIDLIFRNNQATPVLLTTYFNPPYLTIAIMGRKAGWQRVELESVMLMETPFPVHETDDPTLPLGEKIKVQEGRNGCKVELWRLVELPDGTLRRRRENVSIYPVQPEEYKVGSKLTEGEDEPGPE